MKTPIIALITLLLFFTNAKAQANYFEEISGRWQGTLEYLDYTSNKRVTMKTFVTVSPATDGRSATISVIYDDFGKIYRSSGVEKIDPSGLKYFDGNTAYEIESMKEGSIVIVGATQDGNSVEPTRKSITYTADTLTILKETRNPWQFRNVYTLKRIADTKEREVVLSREQLIQDLEILKRSLVGLHPGIFRYNTPAQIDTIFSDFQTMLTEPMSEGQFFVRVSQLVSLLKCGHTFANPYNQDEKLRQRLFGQRTYIPFYFRIVDGRFIVTANASSKRLADGSEIIKINGVPVKEIVSRLLTVTKGDGNSTLEHRIGSIGLTRFEAESYALFDWYFPLLFPMKEEIFDVEAIDFATKKATSFSVTAMTKAERTTEMERVLGPRPTYDDGWKFEIRDGSTGYLKIENSITWRLKTIKFKEFLASVFAELRSKNIKNLIIDVRGNGGGDMDPGFEISRYLAKETLPPYAESRRLVRNVSANPELAKYLSSYDNAVLSSVKNGLPSGMYRKFDATFFEILGRESYPSVDPHENRFIGKTFIIADASNASATFQFLNFVQQNRLATIVGQSTGGNKQGINGGNYLFLSLPNSRIEIDIPLYFQAPMKSERDESVFPDVPVKQSGEDVGNKIDREMNEIKKLIERGN